MLQFPTVSASEVRDSTYAVGHWGNFSTYDIVEGVWETVQGLSHKLDDPSSVSGSHVEMFDTVERICNSIVPPRDRSRDRRVTHKLEGHSAWGLQPSGRNKRGCLKNRVGRENQLLKVLFHIYAMEYMYPCTPPTHTV